MHLTTSELCLVENLYLVLHYASLRCTEPYMLYDVIDALDVVLSDYYRGDVNDVNRYFRISR